MLRRPTARRRSSSQPVTLNLVPMLDAMVTLIAFMLYTMSYIALASIETPFPQASAEPVEEKLKEKPLQLTLSIRDGEVEIWSPFDRIPAKKIPNPEPHKPDLKGIHEALIAVKQQHPTEKTLVIVPHAQLAYDTLIGVMDSSRSLEPSDPPLFQKNETTGTDEAVKQLFPNVVFGNLLGDH